MDKIKIITDSTADLPKKILQEYDIESIPLLINFGSESYLDGVEITIDEMFEKIESQNILPTTAQITPTRFLTKLEEYTNDGYKVLLILMSSNMSGTYQSACIAKDMMENGKSEDVFVIDSQKVCSALGLLAIRASILRKEGKSIEEIVEEIENIKNKVVSSLSFDSLDNLVRGGRISKTVGIVTGVLGIKLILDIKDGLMVVKDKVRGSKKAVKKIISDLEEQGHDPEIPVLLANIDMDEIANQLRDYLVSNNIKFLEGEIGCTVGIHSGKRATGLFFVKGNEK